MSCATPVRGQLIGPECLPGVLDEIPPPPLDPIWVPATANRLVVVGFACVVLLSVFPWSRFGDSSGVFEAWTLHWSLLAVAAGLAGLLTVVWVARRPVELALEIWIEGSVALITAVASLLHFRAPPPLSTTAPTPLLALVAALVAAAGVAMKLRVLIEARRPPR